MKCFKATLSSDCHHEDDEVVKYISNKYRVPVVVGDFTKSYILEDTDAMNADVHSLVKMILQTILCITAKRFFNVKAICRVLNPKRVEILKKLELTLSFHRFTCLLVIKEEANIESFLSQLQWMTRIVISEILVKKEYNSMVCKSWT